MGISIHSCQNPRYPPDPAASSGSKGKNWIKCLLLGLLWSEKKALLLMINLDSSNLGVEGQKEQEIAGYASNICPLFCYITWTTLNSIFFRTFKLLRFFSLFLFSLDILIMKLFPTKYFFASNCLLKHLLCQPKNLFHWLFTNSLSAF